MTSDSTTARADDPGQAPSADPSASPSPPPDAPSAPSSEDATQAALAVQAPKAAKTSKAAQTADHEPDEEPDEEDDYAQSPEQLDPEDRFRMGILLGSILLVALCSITYELIIGTVSSYLLGNSVYQFSLTIGLYMSAMGVGSFFSRYIHRDLLDKFLLVELSVGILGGVSSALLFGVFTFSPYFQPVMWAITLAIGALVGLEIPLLTRHIRKYSKLRVALANVLSWDYIGALFGSLAFPLLLLPALGLLNSAAVIGLINISVACVGMYVFRDEIRRPKLFLGAALLAAASLIALFFGSGAYERFLDKRLFQDPVIHSEQTPYQKLTVTSWRGKDYRLYINGSLQFSSVDEYRYHETLVHVPMGLVDDPESVLILGGGDGLVVRQLKRYDTIKKITMVDLDPRMTKLASTHPALVRANEGSFEDPRLTIINTDAMTHLQQTKERYDVMIIDLPDPNNESLSKLYSESFYRLVKNHLKPGGVMVTQSSAVYFAPNAFWCIHRTIEQEFCPEGGCKPGQPHVLAYHTWVPSFGDWGFNVAKLEPISPDQIKLKVPTKYLTEELLPLLFMFPPDVAERDVKPNRLIEPVLLRYYLNDWHRYNQ